MATKQHVLVVEDDSAIRQGIVDALKFKGFDVYEARTGPTGLEMAVRSDCELVLLDLILPEKDGLEILKEIRVTRPTLPVIILTAKGDESDRVMGLQLGADDYVVKPFSVKELLARVDAVLRRSAERPTDVKTIDVPGGMADLARRELRFKDGSRRELSEREADLLRYLACNPGRAITRDEILARVWRIPSSRMETRTIDMHVVRLREKLRDDSENPKVLLTIRGKGYMFAG
jgi:DNA-binding response OmpR family regulator